MTQQYKVTIQGPGLSVEMTDVPKAICDQITVLILTGSVPASTPSGGALPPAPGQAPGNAASAAAQQRDRSTNPQLSLREFLDELEPKRGPDKITAIGLYLDEHFGQDTFSSAELEQSFQSASEPVPANMPRDIKWTVKTGWIAPALGVKGRYYVTKTGRRVAEARFPKEVVKKTRLSNGRKTAKKVGSSEQDS